MKELALDTVFFCISQVAKQENGVGDMTLVAVNSLREVAPRIRPIVFICDGHDTPETLALTEKLEVLGATVVNHTPSLINWLKTIYGDDPNALGMGKACFSRFDIPEKLKIYTSKPYVCYSDTDVLFLADPFLKPLPETKEDTVFFCQYENAQLTDHFNVGLWIGDIDVVTSEMPNFKTYIEGTSKSVDYDQTPMNDHFRNRFTPLSSNMLRQAWWLKSGYSNIAHFHALKPTEANAIQAGKPGRWNHLGVYGPGKTNSLYYTPKWLDHVELWKAALARVRSMGL